MAINRTVLTRSTFARRLNMPFWTALAVVVAGYAVAFYVLRLVIPERDIAGTLAALVLGGGAYVQRVIETRLRQPAGPVVPMAGYLRPWYAVLLVGVAAIWLAQALVPWVELRGGPIFAVAASNIDTVLRLLPPAAAAGVGIFAGQRSDRWAPAVALGAVGAGWLLSSLTFSLVIGSATGSPGPLPPGVGEPPNPVEFYFGPGALGFLLSDQLPLLTVSAMVGLWYGTRTRLQAYLGGLLREVGPADRMAIVDLTFDAARTAQRTEGSAQEWVAEPLAGRVDQHQDD